MNNLVVPPQFKDMIFVSGEDARTNSLLVAERFGKRHDNVIRAIDKLECSVKFRASNIEESSYIDDKGREQKLYNLTKDGFYKLANSFTGPIAVEWQEQFLEAFNWMQGEMYRLYQENLTLKFKQHVSEVERTANNHLSDRILRQRPDYQIETLRKQADKCLQLAQYGQQMHDTCHCKSSRTSRTNWRKLIKDDDVSKFLGFSNEARNLFPDYPEFRPEDDSGEAGPPS